MINNNLKLHNTNETLIPDSNDAGKMVNKIHSYMIEDPIERAQKWFEEELERIILRKEVESFSIPCKYKSYSDNHEYIYTVSKIGENLGLSAQKLNKLLQDKGIQIDTRESEFEVYGGWILNHEYEFLLQNQYLVPLKDIYESYYYIPMRNLRWTEKGRQWIIEFLKENN